MTSLGSSTASTGKNGASGHQTVKAVLHVGGLHYASEKTVVERSLGAQAGVAAVDVNPVAQTATVEYDPLARAPANLFYPAIQLENGGWYREESEDMAKTIREGRLTERGRMPSGEVT